MTAEMLFAALLAPIRMLFHTQFVVSAVFGWAMQWKSPPRGDAETSWGDALHHHGLHTLLGLGWAGVVYWLNPAFLWWLLPVVGALVVSVPLSVYSSRVRLGRRLSRLGFFLIPEESAPPAELRWTKAALERTREMPDFIDAVIDPITNALACASRSARLSPPRRSESACQPLIERALKHGPGGLNTQQRGLLLRDQLALSELHLAAWSSPAAHPSWLEAQARSKRRVELIEAEVLTLQPATKGRLPATDRAMPTGTAAQLASVVPPVTR